MASNGQKESYDGGGFNDIIVFTAWLSPKTKTEDCNFEKDDYRDQPESVGNYA